MLLVFKLLIFQQSLFNKILKKSNATFNLFIFLFFAVQTVMASYSIQPKENSDFCHFLLSTEKDYGIQSVIFRDGTKAKDYAGSCYNVVKLLCENRPFKDICFMQISGPNKSFESFEKEKYKIVLLAKSYFKLLEFFQKEWQPLEVRMEADYQSIKSRKDWYALCPFLSFQGDANIVFKLPLDVLPNKVVLELLITKRGDNGKTNITLGYSDDTMGNTHLPLQPMLQFGQHLAYISSVFHYKETSPSKRSRQS